MPTMKNLQSTAGQMSTNTEVMIKFSFMSNLVDFKYLSARGGNLYIKMILGIPFRIKISHTMEKLLYKTVLLST